jgi:PAS domain S-box-containing protein
LVYVHAAERRHWYGGALGGGESGVELTFAANVEECHARTKEGSWDVFICDVPRGDGALLDGLPPRMLGPATIVVADSFAEVASAGKSLGALICPYGVEVDLVAAVRVASAAASAAETATTALEFERGQRAIIEQMVTGSPLSLTLERIVHLVEEHGDGALCTILLLDENQRLEMGAAPSVSPEFAAAYNGLRIGPDEGSCGAAMYLRREFGVLDIETHPNWTKYREVALAAGLRSAWSTPILSGDGDVLGAFALYYREPREPTEREHSWVQRATHLAAIAVAQSRTEEALRASEARYRQIVDTAYEGVWLLDSGARTSFVNARIAELLGYSVDEMLGRSLFDFMEPEARAAAEEQFLRRLRKISEQHEFKFRRKDGESLWALVAASPLSDEQGQVIGALGMVTDITRQKRAEETLKRSELELRALFENSAIGIALVDSEGRARRSNRALQKMLGYSEEELAVMRFSDFTHPDDVDNDVSLHRRMLNGEISSYQMEKRYLHRNGSVVWSRLTASFVRMEGDQFLGIGLVEDVTAHKLAQARISAQAALLDQATDAILVRGCDGVVDYWNLGAERLYGWSSAEAVGRNVAEFLYKNPKAFHDVQARLLAAGSWNGELLHVTRDGREVTVEGHWTLNHDERGAPHSVLAINTDVTEKKRLEAQVISAQRMESLGTLAGGIAHDFNNILAAILANVSLASDDLEPDHPVQAALAEINEAGLRAAALVRQILTFSRRRAPERRVIRLDSVADEALKLLRATLPASIRIDSRLDPAAPEIFADPTQVHQVVMNLGTNAAHAMRERGGVLRVSCEGALLDDDRTLTLGELKAGHYARLVVEDTGSGMGPETLKRIFDPFFTTKSPGEGTGLGLSVVHGVLRAHDGAIEVQSSEGSGTRFELYFPVAEVPSERVVPRAPGSLRGHGECVLYIDDEVPIVRATTLLLERLGYEVVAYTQPDQALAEMARGRRHFDAVVTDCAMPLIWGLDFVREIQRLDPHIPIVMTSGLIEAHVEQALRELGIYEFVSKPASVEELGNALTRLLRQRKKS